MIHLQDEQSSVKGIRFVLYVLGDTVAGKQQLCMTVKQGGIFAFLFKKEGILSDHLLYHVCLVYDTDRDISTCI